MATLANSSSRETLACPLEPALGEKLASRASTPASTRGRLREREEQLQQAAVFGHELLQQVEQLRARVAELEAAPKTPTSERVSRPAPPSSRRGRRINPNLPEMRISRTPSPVEQHLLRRRTVAGNATPQSPVEGILLEQTRALRGELETQQTTVSDMQSRQAELDSALADSRRRVTRLRADERAASARVLELEGLLSAQAAGIDDARAIAAQTESARAKHAAAAKLAAEQAEQARAALSDALGELEAAQRHAEILQRDHARALADANSAIRAERLKAERLSAELAALRGISSKGASAPGATASSNVSEDVSTVNSTVVDEAARLLSEQAARIALLELQISALQQSTATMDAETLTKLEHHGVSTQAGSALFTSAASTETDSPQRQAAATETTTETPEASWPTITRGATFTKLGVRRNPQRHVSVNPHTRTVYWETTSTEPQRSWLPFRGSKTKTVRCGTLQGAAVDPSRPNELTLTLDGRKKPLRLASPPEAALLEKWMAELSDLLA